MTLAAAPCKSCGYVHGRLDAKRPEFYGRVLKALDAWQLSASLGSVGHPPELAVVYVRTTVLMLLADEQGLCVNCVDKAVLP